MEEEETPLLFRSEEARKQVEEELPLPFACQNGGVL